MAYLIKQKYNANMSCCERPTWGNDFSIIFLKNLLDHWWSSLWADRNFAQLAAVYSRKIHDNVKWYTLCQPKERFRSLSLHWFFFVENQYEWCHEFRKYTSLYSRGYIVHLRLCPQFCIIGLTVELGTS